MFVSRQEIPAGDAGTRMTVRRMVSIVQRGTWQPVVRQAALRIFGGIDGRQGYTQALALRQWLAENFQFVRDPTDTELLHTPVYLLTHLGPDGMIRADCDDAAILGASLARAVGLQARLVVVAFLAPTAPFRHVWAEVAAPSGPDRGRWVELDVTRSAQSLPPASVISRTWTVPISEPAATPTWIVGVLLFTAIWMFGARKTKH